MNWVGVVVLLKKMLGAPAKLGIISVLSLIWKTILESEGRVESTEGRGILYFHSLYVRRLSFLFVGLFGRRSVGSANRIRSAHYFSKWGKRLAVTSLS